MTLTLLFLQAYRRFESPLIRQQVYDIVRENILGCIQSTFPRVSGHSGGALATEKAIFSGCAR
jgi:hypothetical protein